MMNRQQIATTTTSHLGFGCMRFPLDSDGHIDKPALQALVARAIEGGITYFDTAWPYLGGESEPAVGEVLSAYPRDSYQLATKLPCWAISSAQEAVERVETQLQRLRTDYVDFYLLHALNRGTWRKMVDLGVIEAMEALQQQGKIRHFGFSFHDSYQCFEEILNFRTWDFCQVQLNYMDTNHQAGMRGYHLAEKLGVPLVIMEPLKGGMLAQLPSTISAPFTQLDPSKSVASWGMRWLASLPNVKVILSGMNSMEQLEDNLSTFHGVQALNPDEQQAVAAVTQGIAQRLKNGCTGCRYCMPCPVGVDIPMNFRLWNVMSVFGVKSEVSRISGMLGQDAVANKCVRCGKCEVLCPQDIPIRDHLSSITQDVADFLAN